MKSKTYDSLSKWYNDQKKMWKRAGNLNIKLVSDMSAQLAAMLMYEIGG